MNVCFCCWKKKESKAIKIFPFYITDVGDRQKYVLLKKCCKQMTENCVDGDCSEIVQRTLDILVLIVWKYWYGLLNTVPIGNGCSKRKLHDGYFIVYLQKKITVTYLQTKLFQYAYDAHTVALEQLLYSFMCCTGDRMQYVLCEKCHILLKSKLSCTTYTEYRQVLEKYL